VARAFLSAKGLEHPAKWWSGHFMAALHETKCFLTQR
jgi:hypothetical protein